MYTKVSDQIFRLGSLILYHPYFGCQWLPSSTSHSLPTLLSSQTLGALGSLASGLTQTFIPQVPGLSGSAFFGCCSFPWPSIIKQGSTEKHLDNPLAVNDHYCLPSVSEHQILPWWSEPSAPALCCLLIHMTQCRMSRGQALLSIVWCQLCVLAEALFFSGATLF
jgi:hypothetical protein